MCTACGGEAAIEPSGIHASCPYCGNRVSVEVALRQLRDQVSTEHASAAAARQALFFELEREVKEAAWTRVLALAAFFSAPAGVVGVLLQYGADRLDPGMLPVLQLGAVASGVLGPLAGGCGWALWLAGSGLRTRVQRRIGVETERLRARPLAERCPRCGAGVLVPPDTTVLGCGSCGAELVIAEGVMFHWVKGAVTRAKQLRTQARKVLRRGYSQYVWITLLLVIVTLNASGALGALSAYFGHTLEGEWY